MQFLHSIYILQTVRYVSSVRCVPVWTSGLSREEKCSLFVLRIEPQSLSVYPFILPSYWLTAALSPAGSNRFNLAVDSSHQFNWHCSTTFHVFNITTANTRNWSSTSQLYKPSPQGTLILLSNSLSCFQESFSHFPQRTLSRPTHSCLLHPYHINSPTLTL
jgi:hypothetical protein